GDDRIRDGQTETATGFLGSEIRIKYPGKDIGWNAPALVADRDFYVSPRPERWTRFTERCILSPHFDQATLRRSFASIAKDVLDDLAHLAEIECRRPDVGVDS